MGRLVYNSMPQSLEVEDRTLAHLRLVFMNKLRRSEGFLFHLTSGDGASERSFWIHPSVSLMFEFFGSRLPEINMQWVEVLMEEASSPRGLRIVPEPTATKSR